MPLKIILALTDFSTASEHSLERAAQLAVEHQAELRILYAAEQPDRKFLDPLARLQQRGRQLGRRHDISVQALSHSDCVLDDALEHAADADLLVLDQRLHRHLLKFWRGTTLDHLIRHCECPILVVKQASNIPYEKTLVAIDFSAESTNLVRYASRFGRDSELELFNASTRVSENRLDQAGGRSALMKAYRQAAFQNSHARQLRLSNSFDTRRNRVDTVAGGEDTVRQIAVHQDASRADLVVVGQARRSPLLDLLYSSVARQLIPVVQSDILVVSENWTAAPAA